MKENILIINKYNMAVKKDNDNMVLLSYDINNDEIQEHTEGILKKVNQDIADTIQQYFNIDLMSYGLITTEDESSYLTSELPSHK